MKTSADQQKLDRHPELKLIWKVAELMDSRFRFPGTSFRFGLDPLLNLIPVAGDISGLIISGGLLLAMARKGASNKLVVLMSLNILLDATVGAIPLLGQIFDFYFKANIRNIRLLQEHYVENKHQGSGKGLVIWIIVILFIVLSLVVYGLWHLSVYLLDKFA